MSTETVVKVSSPSPLSRDLHFGPVAWRKAVLFGTSIGIEVRRDSLEVALVRVRPRHTEIAASVSIRNFHTRAAVEWGEEYAKFLKQNGQKHLAAMVVLPRNEVIVRILNLPGVKPRDIYAAIALQADSLHPFGDEPIAFDWRVAAGSQALVGIIRQKVIDDLAGLFEEAGISLAGITFSAAALHAALRVYGEAPKEILASTVNADGVLEIYGESAARPVFSAESDFAPERALAMARSELRLPASAPLQRFEDILPLPVLKVPSCETIPYAAALASACKWLVSPVNLLAAERRTSDSKARLIPTIAITLLVFVLMAALLLFRTYEDRAYLKDLDATISRIEPMAGRATGLDKRADLVRLKIRELDQFRHRPQADLEALQEITRLLQPPIWAQSLDLDRDTLTLTGEAPQAAPLLKIIDNSPLFQNSEFGMSVIRNQQVELFRVRSHRRPQK